MIKTVENKRMLDVQNIMTINFDVETLNSTDARFKAWTFEIEDEGVKTGKSLKSFKSFLTAMTYVLHNAEPGDPFAAAVMHGKPTTMCHIYTHELSAVFHWLRNILAADMSVFTNTWMSPITADIKLNNVIFRLHDTARLVPKTLEEWAADDNLSGNVILEGMKAYRSKYGALHNIPVSQAGEIRRECRKVITDKAWLEQTRETIASYDLKTYSDLVECFMGGTLGVNSLYKGILTKNIYSDDLGSAYPGVMVTRKFPVSPWEDAEYAKDDNYRYYLTVKFSNVKAKGINKFYPFKKCDDGMGQTEDNHALSAAKELTITLTDIDFEIFKKNYDYEELEILECRRSRAEYLPKSLVRLMLKYYGDKTELKGTSSVSRYRKAKVANNCFYGVAVTKTITDKITFENGEWVRHEIKTEEDFNKRRDEILETKQFLSYQIGVWVTAYVRAIMWDIIPENDKYVVYYDTDCIKHTNDTDAFKKANEKIIEQIKKAAKHHKISVKKFMPKNRPIGCFETEAFSYEFKALDIKRYAKRTDDGVEAFISGMPKDHINIQNVDDLRVSLHWTAEESGRTNIYYNDGKAFTVSVVPAPYSLNNYSEFDLLRFISGRELTKTKTKMFRSL